MRVVNRYKEFFLEEPPSGPNASPSGQIGAWVPVDPSVATFEGHAPE
jgi:hypothetical protein